MELKNRGGSDAEEKRSGVARSELAYRGFERDFAEVRRDYCWCLSIPHQKRVENDTRKRLLDKKRVREERVLRRENPPGCVTFHKL